MSVYWRVRSFLGRYPALFYTLYSVKPTVRLLRVRKSTGLVLEGYPRSANSFTAWLMHARHPELALAHHLHIPGQVIAGVRRNLPVCVLIRAPKDAVASFLIFAPDVSPAAAVDDYIGFYSAILPYRDRFVVADFAEATGDFGAVLGRINRKFGTRFDDAPVSPGETEKMFELMDAGAAEKHKRPEDRVGRPSESRRERKKEILKRLPPNKLAVAEALYREFVPAGN